MGYILRSSLVAFFLLVTSLVKGQADLLVQQAKSYQKDGVYDSAIAFYDSAIVIYRDSEEWELMVESMIELCECQWRSGSFDDAMETAMRSEEACANKMGSRVLSMAEIHNNIGNIHILRGEFQSALSYHLNGLNIRKEIQGEDHPDLAIPYTNIGVIYDRLGDLDKSLKFHELALYIDQLEYGDSHAYLSYSYNNISVIHYQKGYTELALEYALKALEIDKVELGRNHEQLASHYNNIASMYRSLGADDLAIEYYKFGLSIREASLAPDHPDLAQSLHNLGSLYAHMGEYEEGISLLFDALEIRKSIAPNHPDLASTYSVIGAAKSDHNMLDDGLLYYRKALKLMESSLEENHPRLSSLFTNIAKSFYTSDYLDSALYYYKKALVIDSIHQKGPFLADDRNKIALTYLGLRDFEQASRSLQNSLELLKEISSQNPLIHFQSLFLKTQVLKGQSGDDNGVAYLTDLLELYKKCDSILFDVRQIRLTYDDKKELSSFSSDLYRNAIDDVFRVYQLTGEHKYLNYIFFFSERGKAGILNDHIFSRSSRKFANLPPEVIELEQSLKVDQSYFKSRLFEMRKGEVALDSAKLKIYEDGLLTTNIKVDSLFRAIKTKYPRYHELRYHVSPPKLSELQAGLSDSQMLVFQLQGEESEYILSVTSTEVSIEEIDDLDALYSSAEKFKRLLDDEQSEIESFTKFSEFSEAAHQCYELLLKPCISNGNDNIDELIIVPGNRLSTIPWGLFLSNPAVNSQTIDYRGLPYLFRNYATRYAYSGSLFLQETSQKSPADRQELLAIAPEYHTGFEEKDSRSLPQFSPLLWNKEEAVAIHQILGGLLVEGASASEESFRSDVDNVSILHLASHAFIDQKDPMNARFLFTPGVDSAEDGILYAHELFNMELDLKMAVLSGCETGRGKVEEGEGVFSLARAFSYAGCPSIVMSNWAVDDESTAKWMSYFYTALSSGASKAEAVQSARLQFLAESGPVDQHPYYWGAFVLHGNADRIVSDRNHWFIVTGILLLTVISALLLKRVRIFF